MAPLPTLTLPSRAVLAASDMKDLTARNQRQRTDAGLDMKQVVQVMGYYEPGDTLPFYYVQASSGQVQSADGQWWALITGPNGISAGAFGFIPGNASADNDTGLAAWASFINSANNTTAIIPPGNYSFSTGVGFNRSNLTINAHGAALGFSGTSGTAFDLNSGALANESSIVNHVRWYGGILNNTNGSGSNTATGIKCRGITRGEIAGLFGQGWGNTLIDWAPRDSYTLRDINGSANDKHIHIPDWVTDASNPQDIWIQNCGLGSFTTAGILIEGACNHLTIEKSYITGSDAIVIETGPSAIAADNVDVAIREMDFEQGTSGEFYVTVQNTNTQTLRSLTIEHCSFAVAAAKCVSLDDVEGFSFRDNYVASTADGWLTLDAQCTDIDIGRNEFPGQSFTNVPAITYSCAREEIKVWPYIIQLGNDDGVLADYNGDTFTSGSASIDMGTALGTNYPGIIDPLAYYIQGEVEDSGSAAASSTLRWSFVPNTSVVAGHRWRHINVEYAGWPDDQPVRFSGMVYADAGDIAHSCVSSSTSTTTVRAKVAAIYLGGGK